jgi:hypothetical protein
MGKPAPVHHHSSHGPRDVLLPIVTLGFYGLRRFRPRSLYNFTALLILAAWLAATVVVYSYHEGAGYLMGPVLFAMAAVTFFRLVPPTTTHKTHR